MKQSILLEKSANRPFRLLVVFALLISVCGDAICQDDTPLQKMNKKELLEEVVTITFDRDQFEMDFIAAKAELKRAKADLDARTTIFEDSLEVMRGKLTTCHKSLNETEWNKIQAFD